MQSVSPGFVRTEFAEVAGFFDPNDEKTKEILDKSPVLWPQDISDAVLYALGTSPHVQVKFFERILNYTNLGSKFSYIDLIKWDVFLGT